MDEKLTMQEVLQNFLQEKTPEDFTKLLEEIERLMAYYRCAMREVETKFRVLDEQLSLGQDRNPIESIKTRLKSMRSIQDKLRRRGLTFSRETVEQNLNDVAGIRVICGFIDDVYVLADCLLKQDDITLIQKKDYIANPKSNGYRSLHLIVEIPIFLSDEKKPVRVEVQLRTIAMESWANLEHHMYYKKDIDPSVRDQVAEKLNQCAEMCHQLDLKMQDICDIVEKDKKATF